MCMLLAFVTVVCVFGGCLKQAGTIKKQQQQQKEMKHLTM